MSFNPTHAVVTLAIRDLDDGGFVDLGTITLAQYDAAPAIEPDRDADNQCILDLWCEEGTIGEKFVTVETAAALIDWPADQIIQRGRQKLARINDEVRDHFERQAKAGHPIPYPDI